MFLLLLLQVGCCSRRRRTRKKKKKKKTRPPPVMNSQDTINLGTVSKFACFESNRINSIGVFNGGNPLTYSFSLLMLQLVVAPLIILLASLILKPLGTPVMISQILGGIIVGPSFLGQIKNFPEAVFPVRSLLVLDTFAVLGTIYYLFLIGLQMDPLSIFRSGRKEVYIGVSTVLVPLILSVPTAILIIQLSGVDPDVAKSLPVVAGAESMLAFPVIACYLSELKLLNTDFGRVALSSSMVSGIVSFTLVSSSMVMDFSPGKVVPMVGMILEGAALLVLILFILRPLVLWMIKQIPEGQTVKQEYLMAIYITVLVLSLLSKLAGLNILFGPFIFGMAIPSGPPLGSTLVERLEFFINWMIMPIYFVEVGLEMDMHILKAKNFMIIQFVILVSCTGKFLGAFIASLYSNVSLKDALMLGLTMNVQGILELSMFRMFRDHKMIDKESFVIMCTSMLFLTGGVTPIIKSLYNSRTYARQMRRTIQHLMPDTQLRVLVCLYNQENVPGIIHLLKASNPTLNSSLRVYVLHLVELVGRASPLLVSHKNQRRPSSTFAMSRRIINIFRRYEESSARTVSVNPFTAVSPYAVMHNDVCSLAYHKKTAIIIIPFHKHLDPDSMLVSFNPAFITVNNNVLARAPCSVGILLDRGLLGGFRFVLSNWLSYHVVVLFVGGADDQEALAYGVRMSEHPNTKFTVIKVLTGFDTMDYVRDSKVDDAVITDIRQSMVGNERFEYLEEVINDRSGFLTLMQSMETNFQLIMLGRNHSKEVLLLFGFLDWDEDPESTELGVIGDLFASSSFGGKATLLVVQQQKRSKRQQQHHSNLI